MQQKKSPTLLNRVSTRLYTGIGAVVMMTLAASIVGWLSFQRIDRAQDNLRDSGISKMNAALATTQQTGELVAAATRLATAPASSYDNLKAELDSTQDRFKEGLDKLDDLATDDSDLGIIRAIRSHGNTLTLNLTVITNALPDLYALTDELIELKKSMDKIRNDLSLAINTAIDDQFFYMVTGFRSLDDDEPAKKHLSDGELRRYRSLRLLKLDTQLALDLLDKAYTAAFAASDPTQIAPLGGHFNFALDRIAIGIDDLPVSDLADELRNSANLLASLGMDDEDDPEGGQALFSMAEKRLEILLDQGNALDQNSETAGKLVNEVAAYVQNAQKFTDQASAVTSEAIRTGRILLVAISSIGVIGALGISILYIGRHLVQRISRLSNRMRTLVAGDLETKIKVKGRDELADMASALEVFRQHALAAKRLNLVEKLAMELGEKNHQLEDALNDLNKAQTQIVAREKLAALGEVTAGVAHEIRNPLNFIKNFSEASQELLEEMLEALEDSFEDVGDEDRDYINEISGDLTENFKRILFHSDRANRIVADMLRLGRGAGESQPTKINTLLSDHAQLAYHSARATDPDFVLDLQEAFDPDMGEVSVISQDMGRVFLNMVANAGDATNQRYKAYREAAAAPGSGTAIADIEYMPTVRLTTQRSSDSAVIKVWDNGDGIPEDVIKKIFEPFFTTKPTDEGTGLGLAMSNDIVSSHGGTITVESSPGEYTEFTITLPLKPPVQSEDSLLSE